MRVFQAKIVIVLHGKPEGKGIPGDGRAGCRFQLKIEFWRKQIRVRCKSPSGGDGRIDTISVHHGSVAREAGTQGNGMDIGITQLFFDVVIAQYRPTVPHHQTGQFYNRGYRSSEFNTLFSLPSHSRRCDKARPARQSHPVTVRQARGRVCPGPRPRQRPYTLWRVARRLRHGPVAY